MNQCNFIGYFGQRGAAAIANVILNRLIEKETCICEDFVSKIGGEGQYDAIGKRIYNQVMDMTWSQIFDKNNKYYSRIYGAIFGIWVRQPKPTWTGFHNGIDLSGGAYFWNASIPKKGFNWNMYDKGVFKITVSYGQSTFFSYSNVNKKWP